jgi:acetylornithine deacetylase
LSAVREHLANLVACDTQNPPRSISGASDIFDYCSSTVGPAFDVRIEDHGDGHVSWYAIRGRPAVLFNVHLDTVPNGDGWETDPQELNVRDGRAYGRGACDIKGAAACLLHLAEQAPEHLALLFTSDEEGAGPCCVKRFIADGHAAGFGQVIVAEPTGCRAILGHRGYLSVKTWFRGTSGHSSEARALYDNANHQMARWAQAAIAMAEECKQTPTDPGACLNIGRVEGGVKSNVIADEAFVHWSARLRPGESNARFLEAARACAPEPADTHWQVPFSGSPLPAEGQGRDLADEFAERHALDIGPDVDFWTEASDFSAAGVPAMVLGPGFIEQAHVANEWVALDQLESALSIYQNVVAADG